MSCNGVVHADCLEYLPALRADSFDAVITDPPYHLTTGKRGGSGAASLNLDSPAGRSRVTTGFMGKAWDGGDVAFRAETWAEVLRVAKPGAYLLAFGGTRTYHRLTCAIEDAGWEIRDCLSWLYGSGFPKSLDVSKAIDKAAGAEREVLGVGAASCEFISRGEPCAGHGDANGRYGETVHSPATAPATDAAKQWQGWGTALKPAWEPIIMARKPFKQTVAANVQEYGTGAINIDACRIAVADPDYAKNASGDRGHDDNRTRSMDFGMTAGKAHDAGRWPANVVLDEESAEQLDGQTGTLTSGANPTRRGSPKTRNTYGEFEGQKECEAVRGVDRGGASRFYYCAKASRTERDAGLDGEKLPLLWSAGTKNPGSFQSPNTDRSARNNHPTVKPISLLRWLVRLVTPPGGVILDPFAGSGSTGCAAAVEGFSSALIEREAEYIPIIEKRLAHWRGEAVA